MKIGKILTIISLILLGLCLLIAAVKMARKDKKHEGKMDDACSLLFFVAVILIAVASLTDQLDHFGYPDWTVGVGNRPNPFPNHGGSRASLGSSLGDGCSKKNFPGGKCKLGDTSCMCSAESGAGGNSCTPASVRLKDACAYNPNECMNCAGSKCEWCED